MVTDFHLVVHNILSILSIVSALGMGLFTVFNAPRNQANTAYLLLCLTLAFFLLYHVVGVNIVDPNLSRWILMLNVTLIFIGIFDIHAIIAMVGEEIKKRWFIMSLYAGGILYVAFFVIFPDMFLLQSVPKMYFTNYYSPGILNWTRLAILFGIFVPYILYKLYSAYSKSTIVEEKNRYKYFILINLIGYGVGFIPNFLVYDIQIDPLWGMTIGVFATIPFVIVGMRYGLFNIKVVAKSAFWFSVMIAAIGGLVTIFNYVSNLIAATLPGFPMWTTSLTTAVVVATASVFIWRRLRQSDLLKYEFITTVTHKFRTPLTHIKWASDSLGSTVLTDDQREQIEYIRTANTKLVSLTNLLVGVSETESSEYSYRMEKGDISNIAEEVISSVGKQVDFDQNRFVKNLPKGMNVLCDTMRIKFIIQVFLENAMHYSQKEGTITVSAYNKDGDVVFSVKDSGIGLTKEELSLMFSKFYRGGKAKLADTEGMGIGLFTAKEIITRHKGKIWVESAGQDMGSTFSFSLPAVG